MKGVVIDGWFVWWLDSKRRRAGWPSPKGLDRPWFTPVHAIWITAVVGSARKQQLGANEPFIEALANLFHFQSLGNPGLRASAIFENPHQKIKRNVLHDIRKLGKTQANSAAIFESGLEIRPCMTFFAALQAVFEQSCQRRKDDSLSCPLVEVEYIVI